MFVLLVRQSVPVLVVGWAPVQSGGESVRTASAAIAVTARFHDVDFAGCRPATVCLISGQHPNSGPNPVTFRQLGNDLDTAVGKAERLSGSDACGPDWVYVVTVGSVSFTAVECVTGAQISWRAAPKIDGASLHGSLTNGLGSERGLDVELAVLDE